MSEKRAAHRFGWIEASLRYVGEFDKKAYAARFRLGAPQISLDQREFLEAWHEEIDRRELDRDIVLQPDHLVIEKGRLVIRHALPIDPVFDVPTMTDWLRSSAIPFREVQAFRRVDPEPRLLRLICDAIRNRWSVRIDYVSLTSGRSSRFISPHALVDSAGRLHVRAFDHLRNEHRDFVLSRIVDIRVLQGAPDYIGAEMDRAWEEEEVLRITVNPELSEEQKEIIRLDYGIPEEMAREIRAPRALAFYIRADVTGPGLGYVAPVVLDGPQEG